MKEQRKHLTEEELKRFLKGIESTRDRAIFTVSYWRGLRAAEPGQLKLSDWDRNAQRLFVHRGNGSVSGQALLSPAESRTLEAWIRVRGLMALLYARPRLPR
jgi:integrase